MVREAQHALALTYARSCERQRGVLLGSEPSEPRTEVRPGEFRIYWHRVSMG